jgi:hypothetical protein
MKQFLCELLFSCTVLAPGAKPVDELTYGTVLYEYFQQDHQAALLKALVAEGQSRRGERPMRFELATGSFAFADGMYGYANEIFTGIPQGELTDLDQMRLAFHLSREYHRRGAWDDLGSELEKIDLGKTWFGRDRFHPEVEFMRAELAMHRGDLAGAELALDRLQPEDTLRDYGLFNLGIAYRNANDLAGAQRSFAVLAYREADEGGLDDEAIDLQQRAKLALAFIARRQQDAQSAEDVLGALPGDGRYREVAMAAYGGLAMDNEDYELAARIWMTLQQQEYWTPSTASARLGFPVSLERLAESGQRASTEMALMQYREAETSFSNRLASLERLSDEAKDPRWVQGLLEVFSSDRQDPEQLHTLIGQWQDQLGHTDWLEWLATERVHKALTQWRDLNGMEDWLGQLPQSLVALEQVAGEQRLRGEQAKELLVGKGLLDKRDLLAQEISTLQERMDAVSASPPTGTTEWMYPLASLEERETIDELNAMSQVLVHMPAVDQQKWAGRIDRLLGVLFYRIVDERAKRQQVLAKQHKELVRVLADLDLRIARVGDAEEQFVGSVGTDFLAFIDRADAITSMVRSARESRETLLANEIRSRMNQEMQQVHRYLLVTRIAIARATDMLANVQVEVEVEP